MIFRIAQDAGPNDWVWEIVAYNGLTLAQSCRHYGSEDAAIRAVHRVIHSGKINYYGIRRPHRGGDSC